MFTGQVRNILFPFDIEADTSVSVATEMVAELDLTDQDVTTIAAMIDAEIQAYFPDWRPFANGNDGTISDGNEHASEAKNEVSALPSELDPSGNLSLEGLPSGRKYWSDSPKATSVGSSSSFAQSNAYELVSHGSLDISVEIYDGKDKDDSFVKGSRRDYHSNSSSPKQQRHSTNFSDYVENEVAIGSSPLPILNNQVSSDRPNRDHEQTVFWTGSQTCNCGSKQNKDNHEQSRRTSEPLDHEHMQLILQKLKQLLVEQKKELDELQKKHEIAIADVLKELPAEQHGTILSFCRAKVNINKQTYV